MDIIPSYSNIAILAVLVGTLFMNNVFCEQVIQTFTGDIGAGNYTYFTLKREGEVTLILDSTEGDADLYVSEHVPKPDFDNYDLQSSTCGRDAVTIPEHFKRPIGIAIFGHVHSPVSKYVMTVVIDYKSGPEENNKSRWHLPSEEGGEPQEESLIWMIFVGILKIIFEILL